MKASIPENMFQVPVDQQLGKALGAERMMLGSLKLIIFSMGFFSAVGGLIGWLLSLLAPAYYLAAYDADKSDIWQIGVGLGLTQGFIAGIVVGCVVVLASAWYRSRIKAGIMREVKGLDIDQ